MNYVGIFGLVAYIKVGNSPRVLHLRPFIKALGVACNSLCQVRVTSENHVSGRYHV